VDNAPTFDTPDYYTTLTPPSTADSVICVSSFANKCGWKDINGGQWEYNDPLYPCVEGLYNEFSSKGPRRDGIRKPDLMAPGMGVVSALSSDLVPIDYGSVVTQGYHKGYQIMAGTSMASPHVAGVVALMLQAGGSGLDSTNVRQYLTEATGQNWEGKSGWGPLDALKTVEDLTATNVNPPAPAKPSGGGNSMCFIATAAFGSSNSQAVDSLRDIRDKLLVKSYPGRWFTKNYYLYSPPIANWLQSHPLCRVLMRCLLRPAIGFSYVFLTMSVIPGVLLIVLAGFVVLGCEDFTERLRRKEGKKAL
jgi:subtilisin family serine protease